MKKISWILALLVALTFAFIGCDDSNYEDDPPVPAGEVVFSLADWFADNSLAAGPINLGSDSNPAYPPVVIAGSPTITRVGSTLTITGRTAGYFAIDISKDVIARPAAGGDYTMTVKIKIDGGGGVKLAKAGDGYGTLKEVTATTAEATLEITDLTTAKLGSAGGIRIQSIDADATKDLTISSIVIKAN